MDADERRGARFLLGLLAVLAVASVFVVRPFLSGIIFALVLGFLLQRPYRAVLRVVRWRPVAATLVILGVAIVLVAPLAFLSYRLVQDVARLLADLEAGGGAGAAALRLLEGLGFSDDVARQILAQLIEGLAGLAKAGILPTLGVLASTLANLGVFVFLLYFILVEGERFASLLREAMPLSRERANHLMVTVGGRVRALFLGTFLVALLQGTLATLGWWLFGLPNPFFWGFVMTVLAVLPAVGPPLVLVPAGLWLISQGHLGAGIGIIAYGVVFVSLVDNLVRPLIVGRSSDVHPALVLVGTLGGLALFGATGFLLGPLILGMILPVLAEWEATRAPPPA